MIPLALAQTWVVAFLFIILVGSLVWKKETEVYDNGVFYDCFNVFIF